MTFTMAGLYIKPVLHPKRLMFKAMDEWFVKFILTLFLGARDRVANWLNAHHDRTSADLAAICSMICDF